MERLLLNILRCFFVLLALTAGTAQAATVLVLGDSISAAYGLRQEEGWVALLERKLAGRHRVVNASVSGETSDGGRLRLPALLAEHKPDVVVLELGGNDALRGLPLDRTQANLAEMVKAVRAAHAKPMLVGMQLPPNYGKRYTEKFSSLYRDLAGAERVPLVPFLLERLAGQRILFQADGIHPTAAAQPMLLETVLPVLSPLLGRKGA